MARVCEVTGKKTSVWNNRSHSLRATRRKFFPNLFYKNILDKETGIIYRIRVSAAGLRTLKKKWVI